MRYLELILFFGVKTKIAENLFEEKEIKYDETK